jgi:prevent-host-death family protein
MAYPLTAAQAHLGELVAETRQSQRPVTISEHGKPIAALISIDDLADLEDRAALAAHLADKAAGRGGISLDGLDAALDRIDAETLVMSLTVVFRQTALRNLAASAARTRVCSAGHAARLPYSLISSTQRTRSRGVPQACAGCT